MILYVFVIFAVFALFIFNSLTESFCVKKEVPAERQAKVFQRINVLLTILLVSSYVKILMNA